MENDYEKLFSNCDGTQYLNLFRDQSIDVDNFLNQGQGNYIFNQNNEDKDYEMPLDEFRVDKSETKSNSKYESHPSPHHIFDVNKECNQSQQSPENSKMPLKEKIFEILKDNEKRNLLINTEMVNLNVDQFTTCSQQQNFMSISERMKFKKEKAKLLLGEKSKRSSESHTPDNSYLNMSSSNSRDYVIDEDKLIPLTDKLDDVTKKEIKILRNRISAQKSRDMKKKELDDLRAYSNNLFNENVYLRNKLLYTENEFGKLRNKTKNCEKCCKEEDITENNNNNNNITTTRLNSTNKRNSLNTTSVVDMSIITRSNFSGRTKLGMLSGVILVVFLICSLILMPVDKVNQGRLLYIEDNSNINNNNSLVKYIVTDDKKSDNKTDNSKFKNSISLPENKNYPIAVRQPLKDIPANTHDENLLNIKRYDFLLNMANKLNINDTKSSPKFFNLRNPENYYNEEADKFCFNKNEMTCKIKNESNIFNKILSNPIVPTNYFDNINEENFENIPQEDIKMTDILNNNIESLLCKDYVTTSGNKNHNFDEIIKQKLLQEGINNSKDSDCMYLHMIIPSKDNLIIKKNEPLKEEQEPKLKTYYEIGCKIFEINKIYK